jgi:hypothetical protein
MNDISWWYEGGLWHANVGNVVVLEVSPHDYSYTAKVGGKVVTRKTAVLDLESAKRQALAMASLMLSEALSRLSRALL